MFIFMLMIFALMVVSSMIGFVFFAGLIIYILLANKLDSDYMKSTEGILAFVLLFALAGGILFAIL